MTLKYYRSLCHLFLHEYIVMNGPNPFVHRGQRIWVSYKTTGTHRVGNIFYLFAFLLIKLNITFSLSLADEKWTFDFLFSYNQKSGSNT